MFTKLSLSYCLHFCHPPSTCHILFPSPSAGGPFLEIIIRVAGRGVVADHPQPAGAANQSPPLSGPVRYVSVPVDAGPSPAFRITKLSL